MIHLGLSRKQEGPPGPWGLWVVLIAVAHVEAQLAASISWAPWETLEDETSAKQTPLSSLPAFHSPSPHPGPFPQLCLPYQEKDREATHKGRPGGDVSKTGVD